MTRDVKSVVVARAAVEGALHSRLCYVISMSRKEHSTRIKRPTAKRRGAIEVETLAATQIYLPDVKPGPLALKLVKALKTLEQ
jgi:hypothetical protein